MGAYPQNVALGYDVGKISAGYSLLFVTFFVFRLVCVLYRYQWRNKVYTHLKDKCNNNT